MRIVNQKDFWAGIMFMIFGAFFSIYGTEYTFGTAAKMGPGYFPTALGVILIGVGVLLCVIAVHPKVTPSKVDRFNFYMVAHVIGGVILFGVLLPTMGLTVALFVMLVVASHASHEFKWKGALVTTAFLILLSFAIFVWGLALQFPIWPKFLVD